MSLDYNIKGEKGVEHHHHSIQEIPKTEKTESKISSVFKKIFSFFIEPQVKTFELPKQTPLPQAPIEKFGKSNEDVSPRLPIEPSQIVSKKPQSLPLFEKTLAEPTRAYNKFVAKFNDGYFGTELPTIHDARAFLEYLTLSQLFDSAEQVPENLKSSVRHYFVSTKQLAEYEELENEVQRDIYDKITRDPELKKTCLASRYDELSKSVKAHLCHKLTRNASPTASPRALFNKVDISLFHHFDLETFYKRQLDSFLREVSDELYKKLGSGWFDHIGRLHHLPNASYLTNAEIHLILRAKQALLDIQTGIGRRFTLDALIDACPQNIRGAYLNVLELAEMRSPQIDAAMLAEFTEEHDRAKVHPRVGIEGAGPTGLLLAMTQFQAGADVAIFEARSGMYERTQVVRLDPIWMRMLNHYLGEKYHALFTDKGHLGILRPDGFGEITLLDLENALHARLTELMSMQKNPQSLVRVAAHEVTDVMSPKAAGKFRVVAKYDRAYDISAQYKQAVEILKSNGFYPHVKPEIVNGVLTLTGMVPDDRLAKIKALTEALKVMPGIKEVVSNVVVGNPKEPLITTSEPIEMLPLQQELEVDMFICAGGKNSVLKDRFFPTAVPVTESLPYGVASWVTDKKPKRSPTMFQGQTEEFNRFPDFRGMIHIDVQFLKAFDQKLKSSLPADVYAKVAAEPIYAGFLIGELNFRNTVQTRTFESRGLIYIGMEIPKPMMDLITSLKRKGLSEDQMKAFQQAFFQTVGQRYGLEGNQLTLEHMDKKFAAMFNVDQSHVESAYSLIERQDGSKLMIATAGDAHASPHFMRYSGLSGAREDILHLQEYQRGIVGGQDSSKLLKELQSQGDATASFVIERGNEFLQPKSDTWGELHSERVGKLQEQLQDEIEKLAKNPSSKYALNQDTSIVYKLTVGSKVIEVFIDHRLENHARKVVLKTRSPTTGKVDDKTYESWPQLKMSLGLDDISLGLQARKETIAKYGTEYSSLKSYLAVCDDEKLKAQVLLRMEELTRQIAELSSGLPLPTIKAATDAAYPATNSELLAIKDEEFGSDFEGLLEFWKKIAKRKNVPESLLTDIAADKVRNLIRLSLEAKDLIKIAAALPGAEHLAKTNKSEIEKAIEIDNWIRNEYAKKEPTRLILKDLDLSYLPLAICSLTELRELNVSNNKLTELPSEIEYLKWLGNLSLNNNQLTSLPKEISNLRNLQIFSIGNNQLSTLPEALKDLKELNYVFVAGNKWKVSPPKNALREKEIHEWLNKLHSATQASLEPAAEETDSKSVSAATGNATALKTLEPLPQPTMPVGLEKMSLELKARKEAILKSNPEYRDLSAAWDKEGVPIAEQIKRLEGYREYAFGTDQWEKYVGQIVGDVPPLPKDLEKILDGDDLHSTKIRDTHILTLVPSAVMVEGKPTPITLSNLLKLLEKPKNGGHEIISGDFDPLSIKDKDAGKPHWVLLRKNLLKENGGTFETYYERQDAEVQRYRQSINNAYQLPSAVDAAASCILHYVRTGKAPFNHFIRSKETARVERQPDSENLDVGDNLPVTMGFGYRNKFSILFSHGEILDNGTVSLAVSRVL